MPNEVVQLSKKELQDLMEDAVEQAFVRLGIDTKNPIEMQADFQHLREWRQATSSIKKRGMMTIVGIIVTGALAAFWVGLNEMMR